MPTTCAVVGCYNRHSKESTYSFYRFPTDPDRRRKRVSFVSRQNADGTPWQPGEGDRVCSEHFISKKKADLPNNPGYVPSVYPHKTAKKKCSGLNLGGNSNSNINGGSLACFEQAQRHAAVCEKERIEKEREEERVYSFVQRALYAFKHDHGGYCKPHQVPCESTELVPVSLSYQMKVSLITEASQSSNIPAEIGKCFVTFHDHIIIFCHFRVSD